jgi:hypothetical protein
MGKIILLSVALVPVWLGLQAASNPRPRRGLRWLLVSVVLFDALYVFTLYYVYLKLP